MTLRKRALDWTGLAGSLCYGGKSVRAHQAMHGIIIPQSRKARPMSCSAFAAVVYKRPQLTHFFDGGDGRRRKMQIEHGLYAIVYARCLLVWREMERWAE